MAPIIPPKEGDTRATTNSKEIPYVFDRNFKSSVRLNINHFLMEKVAGHLLHPKVTTDRENIRIADLGTGTGIWATDFVTQLPSSARIDAFDISPAQYPPESWRDNRVHFHAHNCFEPFPEEFLGKFDVVHVRLWSAIVNDDVAEPLLKNFVTLLKPGGFLQWLETLPSTAHVVSRSEAPTPACDRLAASWKKPAPQSSYNWLDPLAKTFESVGLAVEADEQYPVPDRYQLMWGQSQLFAMEDYHSEPEFRERIQQFQQQLLGEFAAGAFVDAKFGCVVGRRAQ